MAKPVAPIDSGVRPTYQRRSQEKQQRLLQAAGKLIAEADLDSISVADIAQAAGCSVGAVYVRYANKDALFRAVVADMLAHSRDALETVYANATDDSARVRVAVKVAIDDCRRNAGILQSALRQGLADAAVWEPIRAYGQHAASRLTEALNTDTTARRRRVDHAKVGFAFQVLHGTLLNTLIHDPGPLKMGSKAFEDELTRTILMILGLEL